MAAGLPDRVRCESVRGGEDDGGVEMRSTAMMRWDGGVSATLSCGFDTATRKWCEIAGSDASMVCDDFTRPWPDRPARCWVHHASGQVDQEIFEQDVAANHQERRMIALLADAVRRKRFEKLAWFQHQCLQTASLVDAMGRSAIDGDAVTPAAVPESTPIRESSPPPD